MFCLQQHAQHGASLRDGTLCMARFCCTYCLGTVACTNAWYASVPIAVCCQHTTERFTATMSTDHPAQAHIVPNTELCIS